MTDRRQFPGDLQALANQLLDLQEQVTALTERSFVVPLVNADLPVSDPTNMWVFPDGRVRVRLPGNVVKTITTITDAVTATTVPKGGTTTTKQTRTKTYQSTWAETYWPFGGSPPWNQKRNATSVLDYGYQDATFAQQKTMIGFDATTIAADLSGATINKVELFLRTIFANSNPTAIRIGAHDYAAEPAAYHVRNLAVTTASWPRTGSAWHTLSSWFGQSFRDGLIKGIVLDQNSNAASLYGQVDGFGADRPTLRITYTK